MKFFKRLADMRSLIVLAIVLVMLATLLPGIHVVHLNTVLHSTAVEVNYRTGLMSG